TARGKAESESAANLKSILRLKSTLPWPVKPSVGPDSRRRWNSILLESQVKSAEASRNVVWPGRNAPSAKEALRSMFISSAPVMRDVPRHCSEEIRSEREPPVAESEIFPEATPEKRSASDDVAAVRTYRSTAE